MAVTSTIGGFIQLPCRVSPSTPFRRGGHSISKNDDVISQARQPNAMMSAPFTMSNSLEALEDDQSLFVLQLTARAERIRVAVDAAGRAELKRTRMATTLMFRLGNLCGLPVRLRRPCPSVAVSLESRTLSTWDYPALPWSSAQSGEDIRKKQKLKLKAMKVKHQQQTELKDAVSKVVRKHLKLQNKEAFTLQSSNEFWKTPTSSISATEEGSNEHNKTIEINDALQTLTELNGFQRVQLPNKFVSLAEGIVVEPHYHKNESYRNRVRQQQRDSPILWAQRDLDSVMGVGKPQQQRKADKLPILVEEDIKLYRILENNVEDFLNAKYQMLNEMVLKLFSFFNRSVETDNSKGANNNSLPVEIDDMDQGESTESLLFIDRNEIYWVTNMDSQELRLLALADHHTYGHKAASTLISVSLVAFGAIPLAYRSYVFTLDYPGLSQLVFVSVLVTISYGIWSTQSIAVTRQSQVVSNAIAHRIFARNDAVLWALQEGAVDRVTEGVLALYLHYQKKEKERKTPSKNVSEETANLPKTSADLRALIDEIGLIEPKKKGKDETTWTALSIGDAITRLSGNVMEKK